jgi:hypothetical protein
LTATCFGAGGLTGSSVSARLISSAALFSLKRCQSNFDLARIGVGRERRLDDVEAVLGVFDRGGGNHAQKLVAADPNDEIVGAQMTADPVRCALPQRKRRQADPREWGELPAALSGSSRRVTNRTPRCCLLRPTFSAT